MKSQTRFELYRDRPALHPQQGSVRFLAQNQPEWALMPQKSVSLFVSVSLCLCGWSILGKNQPQRHRDTEKSVR